MTTHMMRMTAKFWDFVNTLSSESNNEEVSRFSAGVAKIYNVYIGIYFS